MSRRFAPANAIIAPTPTTFARLHWWYTKIAVLTVPTNQTQIGSPCHHGAPAFLVSASRQPPPFIAPTRYDNTPIPFVPPYTDNSGTNHLTPVCFLLHSPILLLTTGTTSISFHLTTPFSSSTKALRILQALRACHASSAFHTITL